MGTGWKVWIRGSIRHICVWALAAFFAWATVLLAAGPLRGLRQASPFWVFWPIAGAVTAGLWFASLPFAAMAFGAVALVVGLYTELERLGASRGVSGIASIFALVASVGLAFGSWCRTMKISPVTWLTKWVEPTLAKAKELNPALNFEVDSVVAQLPSGLVILGLMVLAIAVLTERTWTRVLGTRIAATHGRVALERTNRWTEFKVWDITIYLLMVTLLAAFTRHEVKMLTMVGLNSLNILIVLFFFQGMAVVFKSFDVFGVGYLWRILIGFVLTFQLAILVAVLGVADYWLEFRNRLRRKPADSLEV